MIILSESKPITSDFDNIEDTHRITREFQKNGWRVFHIPTEMASNASAAEALEEIPEQEHESLGVWFGYVPTLEYYREIYREALSKKIRLVNSPLQHQTILETPLSILQLRELTAESVVVSSVEESVEAAKHLGFPLFVKGVIFSMKQEGWESCVANNPAELEKIVAQLLPRRFTRGSVILRKVINLKKSGEIFWGFPMSREFRLFLFRAQVLAFGFYWPLSTPSIVELSPQEKTEVFALAEEAARRFEAPFVAIDVGQDEDGKWWVIESGDPQFAGLSFIPPAEVAEKMTKIIRG